jgi:hypothetical protein
MQPKTLAILALSTSAAAVAATHASPSRATAAPRARAQFTVMSDRPTAGSNTGASYRRKASFVDREPTCANTTIGSCTVNPCFEPSPPTPIAPNQQGAPLPNGGEVSIAGAEMTPVALEPRIDGSYSPDTVNGQSPWERGGEDVTLQWAHFPGDATRPGGSLRLATPPYIALSTDSAFAAASTTLVRDQDLALSWTSDTPPSERDRVMLDLSSASTQIICQFSAGAGTGVVPAAALRSLTPGKATFDVHSKEYASDKFIGADGTQWTVGFNVDAHARTSYGLAKGPITIQ